MKFLLLLAFGLVVGVVVCSFTREREPSYQGKNLSEWLQFKEAAYRKGKREEVIAANNAMRAMGSNVVPALVRLIAYDPEKNHLARFVQKHSNGFTTNRITISLTQLIKEGERHKFELGEHAAEAFRTLGPSGFSGVPALTEVARNNPWPYNALDALNNLGEKGLPGIIAAANHPDPRVRSMVLQYLFNHTESQAALSVINAARHDPDNSVRNTVLSLKEIPHWEE